MTQTTYRSTTTGLFPLPDGAKEDLQALKGRQKDDLIDGSEGSEIEAVYDEAREEVIDWQTEAGLDRIVEGQLRWDDMLAHPLAVHEAVETGGLRRYYDNNNFYREVRVTGPLTPSEDAAADLRAAARGTGGDRLQAVLPGPVSLFDLATDGHYGDDEAFLDAITDFLAAEVEALPPVATCLLLEPSVTRDRIPVGDDLAIGAIERVAAATDADEPIVHTQWGAPAERVYRGLRGIDGLGIGLDVITAPEETAGLIADHGAPDTIALGVVDGQNTRVEGQGEIVATADAVIEDAAVHTAYLTLNTEGFYLPTERFREKLAALGAATRGQEVKA